MKRPKRNPFPKKTKLQSTVFQGDPPVRPRGAATAAMNHKVGDPNSGLTTNRQKPGGGAGSGGPTTSVD